MFRLRELEIILDKNKRGLSIDSVEYDEIIEMLNRMSDIYGLDIPKHWLL